MQRRAVRTSPNADLSSLLTLSIDHICTSTADMFAANAAGKRCDFALTIGVWGDYGYFMWVPEDPDNTAGTPADLYHIFVYANAIGASYLLIDIDADCNDDLPVYPDC